MNTSHGYLNTGNTWKPMVQVSGPNVGTVVPGEFGVDPYLPALTTDSQHPARGVVIPAGRFVSIGSCVQVNSDYKQKLITSGVPTMTLHNGKDTNPIGMCVNSVFKRQNDFMTDMFTPSFRKGFLAEVIHVLSVNNAQGEIKAGDRVSSHSGLTTTHTVVSRNHVGKPVKWVAKEIYMEQDSASASHDLSAAVYPGITPVVIAAYDDDVMIHGLTAAYAYASGVWTVTFSGSGASGVTDVLYSYGQDASQIAGEVVTVRSLASMKNDDPLLGYVKGGPTFDIPKLMLKRSVTNVALSDPADPSTGETPTTVVAGRSYRFQNVPVSVHDPMKVYVQGTVTSLDGTATTYSASNWYELPTSMMDDGKGYMFGQYHSINWLTGLIEISSNITITAIRVTYSYLTDPQFGGVIWQEGIDGLTDGNLLTAGTQVSSVTVVPTPAAGVPAHLNYSDVVGALRIFVN